jgi:hypothetical protein
MKNWARATWASKCLCTLVLALTAAGCASVSPSGETPRPLVESAESGWWVLRFKIDWPEGQAPSWHTDLLLADRVVRPVLERRAAEIVLWRFHRRAARDAAGHQFSFLFYAPPGTAGVMLAEIESSQDLRLARAAGRVTAVVSDDPLQTLRVGQGATSDPTWSAALQHAWPHYLMGASRMWLELVSQLADPPTGPAASFADLDAAYAAANAAVSDVWRTEGRHAFLHHLNALFGYEPLLLRF